MRLQINHETSYHYDEPVYSGLQQLRARPKTNAIQSVVDWEVTVEGGQLELSYHDQNMNHVDLISIQPGQENVYIQCRGIVETSNAAGVIGKHAGYAPLWYFRRSTDLTRPGPQVRKLIRGLRTKFKNDIDCLHALSAKVLGNVAYEADRTHAETTSEEALITGHGVCQDHTHIFLTAARLMGFPARYVSGYLLLRDQTQQSASHAWSEVFVENIGWIGFDISNGISPDDHYVRVATGLDYKEAAPVSGIRFGSGAEEMKVALQVEQ